MDNGSIWNSERFVLCDKKDITSVVQNNESSAHVPLAWYKSGNKVDVQNNENNQAMPPNRPVRNRRPPRWMNDYG